MAAEEIGAAKCPLCGGRARVSLAKSQLTVMTMNCCKAQLFARGSESDLHIRALLLPKDAPAPTAVATEPPAAPPITDPIPMPRRSWLASLLDD
ncbi:MAG: hypothetical protein J0H69_00595 [Burkholderiales bacterium]|nr:hypothetical protein [Burkholderiales bacterium]